jgi:signal transduction histidine kinase
MILEMSRAFASTMDVDEATSATIRWMRRAVGDTDATVRLALPDANGRLRMVAAEGTLRDRGRKSSARRRAAFDGKRPIIARAKDPDAASMAAVPLMCRGQAVGVVEVLASAADLERGWSSLESAAGQAAIVFRNIRARTELLQAAEALALSANLAQRILKAPSDRVAVRMTVTFCHAHLKLPIAAWMPDTPGGIPTLVHVAGVPRRALADFRRDEAALPAWRLAADELKRSRAAGFGSYFGTNAVQVREAREAIVFTADGSRQARDALDRLIALLGDLLEQRSTIDRARKRNEELEMAIAWTAHELRGPITAVRSAIEHVLSTEPEALSAQPATNGARRRREADARSSREFLTRARRELDLLAEMIEDSLKWATGRGIVRRRATDLAAVVEEAIDACMIDGDEERISLELRSQVWVLANPGQLARAIANIVRNGLTYSPADRTVDVIVDTDDGVARVTVRDHGPGIARDELDSIFDPFVRGSVGRSSHRHGKGLGLFIAARIVDGHGGNLWAESGATGSMFHVDLRAERSPYDEHGPGPAGESGRPSGPPGHPSDVAELRQTGDRIAPLGPR